MTPRSNADLRPRPTGAAAPAGPSNSPADSSGQAAPSAKWRITGDDTADAFYLVDRWLDGELELSQIPLDVITLATEQVQDIRLKLLETAGEVSVPELLLYAFLGFMTNSPYGGQLIQLFTTRVLRSVLNSAAIVQASQTYSLQPTVEFFKYAGQLYRYVPAYGTAAVSSIQTREIAETYELLKSFLSQGLGAIAQAGQAALSDQSRIDAITQGLSQSLVTLGQGASGARPSPAPTGDSPGVALLDQCMTLASAQRHAIRREAASLKAFISAGILTGADVAAQIPPPVEQDLFRYKRIARLQAEALIWVQLVSIGRGRLTWLTGNLTTDASDKLLAYWKDRFGPLIAQSKSGHEQAWRDLTARIQYWKKQLQAFTRYDQKNERAGASAEITKAEEDLDQVVLRYLENLGEQLRSQIAALMTPPDRSAPTSPRQRP